MRANNKNIHVVNTKDGSFVRRDYDCLDILVLVVLVSTDPEHVEDHKYRVISSQEVLT